MFDSHTGDALGLLVGLPTSQKLSMAFSPDGHSLALTHRDGSVRVWNAQTGALLRSWGGHRKAATSVCWSNDGSRIATGCLDGSIRIFSTTADSLPIRLPGSKSEIAWLSFAEDGLRHPIVQQRLDRGAGLSERSFRPVDAIDDAALESVDLR